MSEDLTYSYIEQLKKSSPALKLLNRESVPLVISFLFQEFIKPNRHSIPQSKLIAALANYLYDLKENFGIDHYTQNPKEYLEDWASIENLILRKYYPSNSEEAVFDLTPFTVKVIQWFQSLEARQFVGTESRMKNLFQMLRTLAQDTETNEEVLIEGYYKQIDQLKKKIDLARSGKLELVDPSVIKGQFYEIEDTARNLFYDFRQVEENFRLLDQKIREHFATSSDSKAKVLDKVFEEHDEIQGSDQGKSFRAFWEFLMSPAYQDELKELLDKIYALNEIQALQPDDFLASISFYLLDAGEEVYQSYNLITEQLRKYLEGQVHIENRRIIELIKEIEKHAIDLKDDVQIKKSKITFPGRKPNIKFPMSRTLYIPPKRPQINEDPVLSGEAELDLGALYPLGSVDEDRLLDNLYKALDEQKQISLEQLTSVYPIEEGLAEVLTYFRFATHQEVPALIDRGKIEKIVWESQEKQKYRIELPKVIFLSPTTEET